MRVLTPAPLHGSIPKFLILVSLSGLVAGCGTATPGMLTTASLPPRPAEGMVRQPHTGYTPAATLGAPMSHSEPSKRPVNVSRELPASRVGQKYQWNGNRERVQIGALAPINAQHAVSQKPGSTSHAQPNASAGLTWKASPRVQTPVSAQSIDKSVAAERGAAARNTADREIVVGPADTLFSLASRHNVSMSSLMAANHLTSPALKANQHLILPAAVR
jgi:LysM repeat protein